MDPSDDEAPAPERAQDARGGEDGIVDETERAPVLATALLVLTPFLLFLIIFLVDRMVG